MVCSQVYLSAQSTTGAPQACDGPLFLKAPDALGDAFIVNTLLQTPLLVKRLKRNKWNSIYPNVPEDLDKSILKINYGTRQRPGQARKKETE